MVILARRVLILLGVIGLAATPPGCTQQAQAERQGFWGNLQIGYGSLELISDPGTHERQGALSLGFDLGGTLNRYVRLGGEING